MKRPPMSRGPRRPNPEWLRWLRSVSKGGTQAGPLPSFAVLTGQDMRVLNAIAACWQVMAGDQDAVDGGLRAVAALLPALQRCSWPFARELIAWALDWGYRDKYWPLVTETLEP